MSWLFAPRCCWVVSLFFLSRLSQAPAAGSCKTETALFTQKLDSEFFIGSKICTANIVVSLQSKLNCNQERMWWNIAFESRRDERTYIFSCCNSLGNLLGRRQLSIFCTRSFLEMALSPFLSAWTEKLVSKPSLHSSICLLGLLSKLCWHFMITSSGTWNSEARWTQ